MTSKQLSTSENQDLNTSENSIFNVHFIGSSLTCYYLPGRGKQVMAGKASWGITCQRGERSVWQVKRAGGLPAGEENIASGR